MVCTIVFLTWCTTVTTLLASPQQESRGAAPAETPPTNDESWIQLFNGRDLTGWTPKIRYCELGENFGQTFQVVDGILTVVYDPQHYPEYGEKFGHLFYEKSFANYRLRAEYRFVGQQCKAGPGWATRNNGLMLHCQDPKTMSVDQDFPASIEVQLLGGDGQNDRTTANLCTPGTNVVLNGKLFLPHCTSSKSKTYHGEQWVTVEVEVRGGKTIKHLIDGEVVLEYSEPQLDDRDPGAKQLIEKRKGEKLLTEGFIAIQAESAPTQFRKIELLPLEE
ncbi:MAG: DUF1080 domain-containing protein [Planctomycetaceae bacterium]|nr:DUF1080 domain-containing protein [Planctomycetaceae bacterium]